MTQYNNWQRHPDLYFSDGSIVLLADKTLFRVYIGLLTLHSSVFKELIESAQHSIIPTDAETYDGCLLLRLQDTPEDLADLLKIMLSLFQFSGPGGKPTSYSTTSAVLRLSNKYMMQQFQGLATAHFGRIIPKSYNNIGKEESYDQVFGSDQPHPFQLLTLFRECGLKSFLPWTYYVACSLGFEKLVQGDYRSGRKPVYLDVQDVSIALLGWRSLCQKTQEIRVSAIMSPTASCQTDAFCANHWMKRAVGEFQSQVLEQWGMFKALAQSDGQPLHPDLSENDREMFFAHPGPCKLCRKKWLELEEYTRSVVWSQLPGIFGLPTSVMLGLQVEQRGTEVPVSESEDILSKIRLSQSMWRMKADGAPHISRLFADFKGRRTTRDRDLHARTIILTGAFTHVGLTLLEHLAKKGAHIIVLLPTPSLTSTQNEILTLLRTVTSNEFIYAEPCPLESPTAIEEFCQKFVTIDNEQVRRIDALILAHEYSHIGSWKAGNPDGPGPHDTEKDTRSMATFLLITLLLPAMLVAPTDRDIRIVNVVNPFYAAAIKSHVPKLTHTSSDQKDLMVAYHPTILSEGQRSLRTIIFTRHLQRILDALPSTRNPNPKWKKSNIMAVSVSPGISLSDTVTPALFPSIESDNSILRWRHWLRTILYFVFLPLLYLLTKTPTSSMQSILHVLCVPRPAIRSHLPIIEDVAQAPQKEIPNITNTRMISKEAIGGVEEILVPGALYADCSIVKLSLGDDEVTSSPLGQVPDVNNFGLGDEGVGRSVWEVLEETVKVWKEEDNRKG